MTDLDARAWSLYVDETKGDMDVKDFWEELPPTVQDLYRQKVVDPTRGKIDE